MFQLLKPLVRFEAQLIDHGAAGLPVDAESLGLTAGSVQGEHQLATEPFAQRVLFDQVGELGDEIAVPAEFEFEFDAVLVEVDPPFVEAVGRRLDQPAFQPVEGTATPQSKGGATVSDRLVEVLAGTGPATALDETDEPVEVQVAVGDPEQIALGPGDDGVRMVVGVEQASERRDADLHLGPRGAGQVVAVDGLHQAPHRDDPVGLQRQAGEHDLLPVSAQVQPIAIDQNLKRPQNPYLHEHLPAVTRRRSRSAPYFRSAGDPALQP